MDLVAADRPVGLSNRTRDSEGNYYYHAVLEFMKPHKEHRAVKVCQGFLDGFAYDAPARFALHLGPCRNSNWAEYCDYPTGRARGRETEAFRLAPMIWLPSRIS